MLYLILLQGKQNFEMATRISTLLVYVLSPGIWAKLNMMDFTPTVRLYERWRDFANVLGAKWFDLEVIKKGWYDLIGSALKRYCPFLKKRFGEWGSLTGLEEVNYCIVRGPVVEFMWQGLDSRPQPTIRKKYWLQLWGYKEMNSAHNQWVWKRTWDSDKNSGWPPSWLKACETLSREPSWTRPRLLMQWNCEVTNLWYFEPLS